MANNNNKRGLAKADEETRERVASMGGQASPGKFEAGSMRARSAGKKGGQNRSSNSQ
jgi:general stress protein YciG